MYVVIRAFRDTTDNDRLYCVGDAYPARGKASKKRVEELLSGTNRNGKVYIREEAEPSGDNAEPEDILPDEEQ